MNKRQVVSQWNKPVIQKVNETKGQVRFESLSQQLTYVYQEIFQWSGNVIEIKKIYILLKTEI